MTDVPDPPSRLLIRRPRLGRDLGRKLAELVTVFVGVYAAFLLNDYQAHRAERQHRDQILAWLEKRYSAMRSDIDRESSAVRQTGEKFNRAVADGQMPPLREFYWNSNYQALDLTGLLQSGGYALLEIETVRSLKDVDDTLRSMVTLALHTQQLSDELVLPNLDKGPVVFYDPATKRLRAGYEWYGEFWQHELDSYADLRPQLDHVLDQLRLERARNR